MSEKHVLTSFKLRYQNSNEGTEEIQEKFQSSYVIMEFGKNIRNHAYRKVAKRQMLCFVFGSTCFEHQQGHQPYRDLRGFPES
jgi:hypothetical protein